MHKNLKTQDRYMLDGGNRLNIKRKQKRLTAFGRFSVDRENRLVYWLNEPASWRREYDLPEKIVLLGEWRLNSNYELELVLQKTERRFRGNRLLLKGEIISTDRDTLAFEITSYDKQGLLHMQILKLSGCWQADQYNRISFIVKKKVSPDILTLEGAWQINQNQQITYSYEKTNLKTKSRSLSTLTFEGFWKIGSANRLTYIIAHSSKSRFDFRAQIESPNLYPEEGTLKYRLGIGVRQGNRLHEKIISLYGAWRLNRKLGIVFQMDYGNGRFKNIEFGTNIHLTKSDEVILSLTNKKREPLGINITFSHRFLKEQGAEALLRLKQSGKESGLEAGVRILF